jgi:hypothetical protein
MTSAPALSRDRMQAVARYIVSFLALTTSSACLSDSVINPSDMPAPPPAASLDADLSFFAERTPVPGGGTTSWAQALQTVAAARSDMAVLEVPEALLRAATAGQGMRDGGAWRWPFSTVVDGAPYEGELRSTVVGHRYEWNLFVSAPDRVPQLSDYLWAQGYTGTGGHDGLWSLADVAAGSDSVVARVSWIRNPENFVSFGFSASDTAGWRFERTQAGNALTYIVHSIPEARVTWDPATGTGGSWTLATSTSCWDENLHDVSC